MKSIAHVGMDVHKDSIVVAILPEKADKPVCEHRIENDVLKLKKFILKWDKVYDLRCCYEASSCGYVMHRWLSSIGIACDVIAPSLVPKRAGERVKTDRKDALKLARLHRSGELVNIYIPTEQDEAVRCLVRCRETMSKETGQSKHYILKFLSARGFKYPGKSNWTKKHWEYLRSLKFDGAEGLVFNEYLALLEYKQFRLEDMDREIEKIAGSDTYRDVVGILRCLRGIDTLSAMVLVTEIMDFRRFGDARQLMSYLGLVPSESSSGSVRRQGGITKTGNSRCRRILVQAAWHYMRKPSLSAKLKERQAGQPACVIAHSWKAQHRLYKKFWGIALRKERCKAVVAVARELVGFIWALVSRTERDSRLQAA